jgi:predicted metal-binding transcription factor (methanogenesis marker protein 9)
VISKNGATLSPAEMLESIYKLKENVLENIKLQRETGKLISSHDITITEINQISYQVIVRLIKEEYRNDRKISVKRLAQIIRRMLPDIKELKYLLPKLKDGLFAEGMSPSDYLSLVKELSKELDSDELIQVMVEASDQIGLTLNELIEGIKEAPEEAARLIVLAAEIKKGCVKIDDQQMSAVLSDYIERVSRALALQSPEAAAPGGGAMLKAAVTRIEREIIDRLKSQNVGENTVSEVAQKLATQFAETVSVLQGDWVRTSINSSEKPNEEMLLSIIEQVAEHGQKGSVTGEIRAILISNGFSAEMVDDIVKKAQLRAASAITHAIEIPSGVLNASSTLFFLDREIKRNLRYNSPFSTMLVSYEEIVDIRTFTMINLTPDIHIQLTNQSLNLMKVMEKRALDLVGICTIDTTSILLIVLPMTDLSGAIFVKKRIEREFPHHEFLVNDITVHVIPKVTLSDYNKNLTPDIDAYLKAIYHRHCQPKLD